MRKGSIKERFAIIAALLALLCATMAGQSTSGDVTGTVYDATGGAIAGATVTATSQTTGIQTSATSGQSGQYRLSNLMVGMYDLKVTAKGFDQANLKNVTVDLNKIATANVTLEVGKTSTSVEVTDSAATIDTTTANVSSTFNSKQVSDLPLASTGSGVINLSLLTAGVSSSGAVGVGTGPSVGGQRPRNNDFTIEGIDNNSKSVTGPLVNVPNDAVAEFSILENQFSPEFGHSSGGQFNQIIRSGTNSYHGGVYEYLQNRNLNAADQQSIINGVDPHPRYDNNRLGGNFGGPILKNKLFFFGDFQYNPVGAAGSGGQIFAPTAAGYATLDSLPGLSATNLAILKQYLPATPTAVDPAITPSGAYPVVGGKTIELGQFSFLAPNYTNSYAAVASVDYNLSDSDSMRGRFIYNRQDFIDTAATLPAFYTTVPARNYLATFSEFHTFSPTLNNEFRLGFNRYFNVYGVGPQKFPGLDAFPNLDLDALNISIGPDGNAPQETIQNNYQGTDNVSWTKGNHSFKFGVNMQKLISPQTFTQRSRGEYEWSTLEGYLTDQYPDAFGERTLGNVVYYGDQIQFGTYANDDWKIRPNLTINLGLRYEHTTLPYSERLQNVNSISSVPGLISFNTPKSQMTNFMPRVGFAWSPGTSGNTSIRAGFGINYDQLFDNLGILSLPPQFNHTVDVGGLSGTNFLANGGIPPNASSGTLSTADARANTSGFIPDQKLPKSIQWNIGVQHVFARNYTFEARYLGSRGLNLPVQTRINSGSTVTPQNALPVYMTAPSQATLDSLTNTKAALVDAYNNGGYLLPSYLNEGFYSLITAFMPIGNSTYHGLATTLTRRFSNGLQFNGAYTWSHNIDDSTAEVFSTVTTPRRPQDFQNLRPDRASSALDHRQRFTLALLYDMPYFKDRNWFMKNLVGNWEVAPVYTYQTGTLVTVLSKVDANLNADSYTDRAIINPAGTENVGTGTTALKNSGGDIVGYLVKNPNARYIQAPTGALPNGGRNSEHLPPIDDIDIGVTKRFSITERYALEFTLQAFNVFNHPQYEGGYINDVAPVGFTSTEVRNFLNPVSPTFYRPDQVFSSNPRTLQIAAKFIF